MARKATQTLLHSPVVSPAKLVRVLEKDVHLLPVLYPMLVECVKAAGSLLQKLLAGKGKTASPGSHLSRVFKVLDKSDMRRGTGAVVCMAERLGALDAECLVVPVGLI